MSVGVERRATLAPAPESARTARRMVAEVLSSARADQFIDTATLLTSELVTNGIVHAHTDLEILVDATPRWVRVEVIDGNPQLPARREYHDDAGTGRGMEMVELLADEFGVEPIDGNGKRVWFRLGDEPGTPVEQHESPVGTAAPAVTRVQLQGVPVALYCVWQEHAEALLREASLAALDGTGDNGTAHTDYPLAGAALSALADAAAGLFPAQVSGALSADIDLELPSESLGLFPILRDVLARVTVMAVAGKLLTPPSLPEIMAVRRWVCDEVARQSAGLPPMPWAEQPIEQPKTPRASTSVLKEVRNSDLALIASDASNRIVAISPPAAELLGWPLEELEGKRLVTIIPPEMRNRHIAGFSRYLLEGAGHIIGRSVAVEALRRDGSRVAVELLVERRADRNTRGVFIATLTPR